MSETGATAGKVQRYPRVPDALVAFSPLHLLVYLGVVLGLIGTLALPWVHVKITILLQFNLDFKLLENAWLTAITVVLLLAIIPLVHWRRAGGWAAVAGGAGCMVIAGIYAYGMAANAFHILGILKSIPLIGGPLGDFARNVTSASPDAGAGVMTGRRSGSPTVAAGCRCRCASRTWSRTRAR